MCETFRFIKGACIIELFCFLTINVEILHELTVPHIMMPITVLIFPQHLKSFISINLLEYGHGNLHAARLVKTGREKLT